MQRCAPFLVLLAAMLPAATLCANADAPATIRVDYIHSGNALQDSYALDRIVIEPLPWPGNPARPVDDTNRGVNLFEVVDPRSGEV
ncbi:MAG TPA: peptidase M64 N-terminal domain-containing protein, partial [Povalibacter sp.]